MIGLYVVAHLAVRRFAPNADPTLLPLAALLNGIGFVTISRLDRDLARIQAGWTVAGVAVFVITLVVVRRIRTLERYRYTFLFLGIVALVLPLAPGIGQTINGARLWVGIGPLNFEPSEIAKVLLVVFFAAYLVDKRELLGRGAHRVGGITLPALKRPRAARAGVGRLDPDHGAPSRTSARRCCSSGCSRRCSTSRRERGAYLIFGLVLFVGGAVIAYQLFGHVRVRVEHVDRPVGYAHDKGFQIVQSLFAFGSGGVAGTGLGLGSPQQIPNAATDFVFSAIGEELGLVGTIAVVTAFLLLVGSGFRIAVQADRPFPKLFAAGLATILGFQTFLIIGGVTRVIPLTGITLPFVSYGGSSLVANFVLIAILLRISDDSAPRRARRLEAAGSPEPGRAGAGGGP